MLSAQVVYAILSRRLDAGGGDAKGISNIEKTGSLVNVDTYTITYTDGTTSTFEVTNGVRALIADGETAVSFYINEDGDLIEEIESADETESEGE